MSIFGERIRRPGPEIGTILSEYVKKDYVDAQDGTIGEAPTYQNMSKKTTSMRRTAPSARL